MDYRIGFRIAVAACGVGYLLGLMSAGLMILGFR